MVNIKSLFIWMAKIIQRQEDQRVQASSFANDIYETDILHFCGLVSGVPNGTKVLAVKLGRYRDQTVLLPIQINDLKAMASGDVKMYATNAPGDAEVGSIQLTHDGKLHIATQKDDLLALLQEILTTLSTLHTFGSPTQQQPLPSWIEKIDQLKQRLDNLSLYK